MASLTGQLVAETYKALLKTIDNDILTASEKQITDGFGGGSNVFIDSQGFLRANKYKVTNGLATQFLKADGSLDANTYLTGITSSQIITALGYTPVTNARTLTINGTTYDLSANRSWTIAGTAAIWGNISGTLSDQTDLQNALNAKFDDPTGTISQYIRGDGSIANFPSIAGGLPTGGTAGQILAKIDATDYNAHWIDNYATQTKNEVKLGQTLTKGTPVYVSSANGTNIIVSAASNASEATSSKTLGLLETGGATNDLVKCVTFGLLAGLDTSTATAGDPVWLGVNGALIFGLANKPYAPAHLVYIGVVTRVQQNNGEIFVNVQNGFELKEIHDVLAQSPTNNDGLFFETSTGLWKNKSIATVLGYTPQAQLNGTGFVKASGTTISYDNSTYLTTADAASTYQRLDKMVSNLLASATEYPNSNAVINALALKADALNPVFTGYMTISGAEPKLYFTDTDQNPDYFIGADAGFFRIYDQTAGATRFVINSSGVTTIAGDLIVGTIAKSGGTATQFLKADGSIDSSTYVTSASLANYLLITTAASTYQRLDKMVSNLLASDTEYPNSNAVLAKLALKADAANPVFTGDMTISGIAPKLYFTDTDNNPDYTLFVDSGYFYIYDQTAGATKFQITPSGNAINTGTLTSASFIKSGGTSSQYLMADGSVTTGPNLSGYVPYTGATTNVDLGSRTLTTSLLFVNPVASLASGAVIRTYNYSDPNWGFSNTQAAGVDSNQYHVRVHGSGGTYGTLRQFQVIDASQSNNVRFGVNFDGSGAVLSSGLGLGGNFPTADRQFYISGSSFTTGTNQYQAVLNTTFVNAATNIFGLYVNNNSNVNATNSYSLFIANTGGSGSIANKWGIYQTGSSDNNYFAGKVLVNTNTDAGYMLDVNGLTRVKTLFPSYAASTLANQNSGIIWTNGTIGNAFGFVIQSGLFFQGDANASNNVFGVKAPTNDGSLGTTVFNILSTNGNTYIAGNVGIGTTTPIEKLDINGILRVLMPNDPLTGSITAKILSYSNSPYGLIFRGYGSGIHSIQSQRESNSSELFSLSLQPLGGNVLIGTTTDSGYNLDVNGTGRFNGRLLANYGGGQIQIGGGSTLSGIFQGTATNNLFIGDWNTATKGLSINVSSGNSIFSSSVTAKTVGDYRQPTLGTATGAGLFITNSSYAGYGLLIGNSYSYGDSWIQVGRVDGTATAYNLLLQQSGGNVGIGTTSPNGRLSVRSSITTFELDTDSNGCYLLSYDRTNSLYKEMTFRGSNIIFSPNDIELMRINSSGNVGIGTNGPISGGSDSKWITLNGNSYGGGFISSVSGNAKGYLYYDNGSQCFAMQGASSIGITFLTSNSEKMRITSGGNVLIGTTTNNGYQLQVNGTATATNFFAGGSTYNTQNALVIAGDTNWTFGCYESASSQYWMQVKYYGVGDDNRGFRVFNMNGNTVDFRVNGSGNGYFRGASYATAFYESSDMRLKTLIENNPIIDGIENLEAKLYQKNGKIELGYFAQDAELYMPYSVIKSTDGFLNLSYREVHTAKIARLEKRVAELEKQLNLN